MELDFVKRRMRAFRLNEQGAYIQVVFVDFSDLLPVNKENEDLEIGL